MLRIFYKILVAFACITIQNAFKIQPRIINGDTAVEGQFPYYVHLKIETGNRRSIGQCGGVLINEEWILTAGHCLNLASNVLALLGASEINTSEIIMGDGVFKVGSDKKMESQHRFIRIERKNIHIHSDYVSNWNTRWSNVEKKHDIGLIQLPQKIQFTSKIQPVHMPKTCYRPETVDATMIGFGRMSGFLTTNKKLMFSQMKTLPSSVCLKHFPFLSEEMFFCATNDQLKLSERGDSGSPLLMADANSTLIGITVIGDPKIGADGFTNVYAYLNWIRDVTGIKLPKC